MAPNYSQECWNEREWVFLLKSSYSQQWDTSTNFLISPKIIKKFSAVGLDVIHFFNPSQISAVAEDSSDTLSRNVS